MWSYDLLLFRPDYTILGQSLRRHTMQSFTYRLGAASTLLSPPIASSIVDSDMSPNALAVAAVSIPVPSKSQNLHPLWRASCRGVPHLPQTLPPRSPKTGLSGMSVRLMISGRWALMVLVAFAFFLVERVAGKATACGETCVRGACKFTDCKEPSFCPGGACTFKKCVSPTCEGGSCIFDSCSLATCEGAPVPTRITKRRSWQATARVRAATWKASRTPLWPT